MSVDETAPEGPTAHDAEAAATAVPQGGEGAYPLEAEGTAAVEESGPDAPEQRDGYLRAGNEDVWIEAKGDFEERALKGYLPSPESDELRVELASFDGPLDLLLHLIRAHALDVLNIPIAHITQTYLAVLDDMRTLNLDIAGEFLVMAAQLAHIKSKMLLPRDERPADDDEDGEDPRAALVRRLLEYQRFQEAAGWLSARNWLGRDIFFRPPEVKLFDPEAFPTPEDPTYGLVEIDPVKLIELFDRILKRSKKRIVHEVILERLSVGQRINELVDFAASRESFTLGEAVAAFGGLAAGKSNMIVTFLAILEMTKFKLLRIHQAQEDGAIYIASVRENLAAGQGWSIDGYGDESGPPGAQA